MVEYASHHSRASAATESAYLPFQLRVAAEFGPFEQLAPQQQDCLSGVLMACAYILIFVEGLILLIKKNTLSFLAECREGCGFQP